MGIFFGSDVFIAESYMVELYWFQGPPRSPGVFVLEATNVSCRTGLAADWEVFYLPSGIESWIIGERYGQSMGNVADVFPGIPGLRMPEFLRNLNPAAIPYHGWVGFSMNHQTIDGVYHCLDFYWQGPMEYCSGMYHHFLLRDVSEPTDFYMSQQYTRIGHRAIQDDPAPEYPRCQRHSKL